MKGKFIVFEGIDGSGKTTQINKLSTWLRSSDLIPKHNQLVITREPGGTKLGKSIRSLLLDNSIETIIFRGIKNELNFKKFDQFILEKLNDNPNNLNDIIISKSLLQKLNISIGDNITLYFQTFDNQKIPNIRYYRVYGVYETDFPDFDSSYIIGSIESLQNLYELNYNDVGAIELIIVDK